MLFSFKETGSQDPLKWFELHLGNSKHGLGIFWPTKELHEFAIADIETMYGIDVECEALRDVTKQLCEILECLAFDMGRTRLELVVAVSEINAKLSEKWQAIRTQQELDWSKPKDICLDL